MMLPGSFSVNEMKKKYLYIDSSLDVQIGIINENYEWEHLEHISHKKSSTILHRTIFNIMSEFKLDFDQLAGVIIANGPGSYTGIRLTEGISQILKNEGVSTYSFYHFEVPAFCQINDYVFYANAFKGEVFKYVYNNGKENLAIINKDEFKSLDFDVANLFHINGELEDMYLNSTKELIDKRARDIFSRIIERGTHLEPFYFRSLEKEFKPSQKSIGK